MPPGRKRKPNVLRSANGKSRGEPNVIDPMVLYMRARELKSDGVPTRHAHDALAGFTLGRLLLRYRTDKTDPGAISPEQYEGGDQWAKIVRRHAAIMGFKLTMPSAGFVMVSNGASLSPDPGEATIQAIKRRYRACYDALIQAGRTNDAWRPTTTIALICYAVCLDNRPIALLTESDYGNLRVGLSALHRTLQREC